jgi:hypothetical protein
VTATPAAAPPGVTPGAAPPVTGSSGKVFWIAMILVAFVGIVGLLVLPFVFPSLDWFGLSSLNDEKTVSVRQGETIPVYWDSPLVQKATVTVRSPGKAVNVYVVLKSDLAAAIEQAEKGNAPPNPLASKPWVESTTVEVEPGKKPFAVLLQTKTPRADVTVTVKGK